jgi:hypothetical protein
MDDEIGAESKQIIDNAQIGISKQSQNI